MLIPIVWKMPNVKSNCNEWTNAEVKSQAHKTESGRNRKVGTWHQKQGTREGDLGLKT